MISSDGRSIVLFLNQERARQESESSSYVLLETADNQENLKKDGTRSVMSLKLPTQTFK